MLENPLQMEVACSQHVRLCYVNRYHASQVFYLLIGAERLGYHPHERTRSPILQHTSLVRSKKLWRTIFCETDPSETQPIRFGLLRNTIRDCVIAYSGLALKNNNLAPSLIRVRDTSYGLGSVYIAGEGNPSLRKDVDLPLSRLK
ncbi:hypothetical protein AX15_005881 [Amanita polypyramis BW_CC]|nr:hypothetical protein AX15_005881 [Amanita polypyramis BW_CC]